MDAADEVARNEERAMQQLDARIAARRLEEARQGCDPDAARDCLDCGVAIPKARLKAYPMAGRCLRCAELVEQEYATRWRGG